MSRGDISPRPVTSGCGTVWRMSEYDDDRAPGTHLVRAGMRVVRDGPREAPPLLLIHGSGFSGASWDPVVPALAGHHHVIRIDLPGCGKSSPAPSYDVPAQAGRVAALLDALDLGPVTVVGHSSGGYIATALAEQRRDLVRSIALVSTGPSRDAFLPQPLLLRALTAPPLGALLWARRSDAMIRRGISLTCARPVAVPDALVADVQATTYRTVRAVLRCNDAYLAERSVPERLAALGVPLLVLFGAADRRWEPSSARRYDAVPNSEVVLLADVGHLPMLEVPEATGELLLGFTVPAANPRPVPRKT